MIDYGKPKKTIIIYVLNNQAWIKIIMNSNLVKIIEFYQKLKLFYLDKFCVPKVTWNVKNTPDIQYCNAKALYIFINSRKCYFSKIINICFEFDCALKKYNDLRYNKGIVNCCYIKKYELKK